MGVNYETAKKAEAIARRMCREAGQPESLWQIVLTEAYQELFGLPAVEPAREGGGS